jgi:hypothetical protein
MSRALPLLAAPLLVAFGGSRPDFDEPRLESSNGAAMLEWSETADAYQVEMSESPQFADARRFYEGRMNSAQISGLYDGTYHFRVRGVANGRPGAWSDPAQVVVEHHPMSLVWPMFAIGALVFLGTAGFVAKQALGPGRSA